VCGSQPSLVLIATSSVPFFVESSRISWSRFDAGPALTRGSAPRAAGAGARTLIAEALLDPDQIWIGVTAKIDPIDQDLEEPLIDLRCTRVDPDLGIVVVLEGDREW